MPQRNLLLLLAALVISYVCYAQGEQDPFARYTADGLAAIGSQALDEVPSSELFRGAMEGMVDVLRKHGDAHSQYLDEAAAQSLRTRIRQQLGGIGAEVRVVGDPPRLVIAGPIRFDSPAAKAKLKRGDRILQIDGARTDGMSLGEVSSRMRGDSGTTLRLVVQSADEKMARTVEVVRELVPIDSIYGDRRGPDGDWIFTLESDSRIAHVRVVSFGDRTASEFQEVVERLLATGVRGIVLDVRDNDGGSLSAAVAICEMFLPAGKTIVETRGRGQTLRQRYETRVNGPLLDVPLAVIVNQNSASASEIIAASLQDHGRGTVVGERTFGKGTVQQMLPLESGRSLLKLTWASFWRPSGVNIHRAGRAKDEDAWGVTPNAGFERKFSPDEYAAYVEFRNRRDDFDVGDLEIEAGGDSPVKAANTGFVDEQLELATRWLNSKFREHPASRIPPSAQ